MAKIGRQQSVKNVDGNFLLQTM